MVTIYYESNSHAELVAFFRDEETFMKCFRPLEKEANEGRMIVTESLDEETFQKEVRRVLRDEGFFTEKLWHIRDVMDRYDCDEAQAQSILRKAFDNEATYNQIWLSIDVAAEGEGVAKKPSEEELHQQARDLMAELDDKHGRRTMLSLEEYYADFIDVHTSIDSQRIKNLLDKFHQ